MNKNLAKEIGAKIKSFREDHLNISQEDLSERSSVHVTHLSRIENGGGLPSIETLIRICRALGIAVSEVIPEEGKKKSSASDPVSKEILRLISNRPHSEKQTLLRLLKSYLKS